MREDISRYKHIQVTKRTHCVVCGKKFSSPLIRLPQFPLTEIFVRKKPAEKAGFSDQEFHLCGKCGMGQLKNIIDPAILYGSNYKTRTTTSSSAVPAVDVFLDFVNENLKTKRIGTIFEIGCNDLYALKKLESRAQLLYGIDPILKGREQDTGSRKIRVIGDFFENVDVKSLGLTMDVFLCSHTLEHISDPKNLIAGILAAGNSNTLYFFQFPGLESLVNDAHFDQIFHQHLNYFSLFTVQYMLEICGAELVDCRINPYHWGALMIAFRKKTKDSKTSGIQATKFARIDPHAVLKQYGVFKRSVALTAERLDAYGDRTMYGYGAALMLPVLEYYLKRIRNLKNILDEDRSKKNLYYVNLPVQIKRPEDVKDLHDSVVLVTAINSLQARRAIVNRLIHMNAEKIIVPVNII